MEKVTLNSKEQGRLMVLNKLLAGQLTAMQASELLQLSLRQVRRILAAYRKEGAAALAHANRGRCPANAIDPQLRLKVLALATSTYQHTNQQHLSELLAEREGIAISRSSLRRILLAAGVAGHKKRRAPRHRSRRARYSQFGMLVQIDGSDHDWLEARGPRLSLLVAIDDASGQLLGAIFRQQEDACGYMLLVRQVVERYGRPLALYHDRHGIFERSPLEKSTIAEQLAGERQPTQFGRVLKELEIRSIAAHSPQAKGRVERVFGTLQDRLVVELRLAAANSLLSANRIVAAYLPRFNERFGVPAEQPGSACRAMAQGVDLESIFCMKYERVVAADNTVQFAGQRLQLLADSQRRSWVRCRVEVQERLDGSIALYYQGKCLATKAAPAEAVLIRARHGRRADGRGSTNSPNEQQEAMASKQVEAAASTCLLAGEAAERVQEAKDGEQAQQGKPRKKRPWDYPLYPERVTKSLNS